MSGVFPGNSSLIQQLDSTYMEDLSLAVSLVYFMRRIAPI